VPTTTIRYDNTDVESGGGGEHAQPGMYAGKIVSVNHRTQKTDGSPVNDLEVVVDIGQEYRRLWTYIGLEKNTAWKMREFTDAVGLPPKGTLTTAALKKLEGTKVNVKVSADTDLAGDYRGRVKNLFKPGEGGALTEATAEADGAVDYDEWSIDDLKAELEERGIELPKGRLTESKLVTILQADDESAEEDEDEDEDEAEVTDEYDEWELDDLKAEVEERGATGNLPKGRKTKQTYIDLLRELDEAGSDDDADTPDAEADEYDTWDLADLKAEIAERNEQGAEIEVTGRASKEKLVAALREDDANAEVPF
jgi:hypothetical protein